MHRRGATAANGPDVRGFQFVSPLAPLPTMRANTTTRSPPSRKRSGSNRHSRHTSRSIAVAWTRPSRPRKDGLALRIVGRQTKLKLLVEVLLEGSINLIMWVRVEPIPQRVQVPNELHVLLRYRPRSISRREGEGWVGSPVPKDRRVADSTPTCFFGLPEAPGPSTLWIAQSPKGPAHRSKRALLGRVNLGGVGAGP
jgi:hypothetical protein